MRRIVEVWVCENPDCQNYYGARSIEGTDLSTRMNTDLKKKPTFPRDVCQVCSKIEAGEINHRVCRYAVVLDFGPERPITEEMAVEEAYKLLREAGHASVS